MCSVSVIMDYGRTRIPPKQWTPSAWSEYKEILKRLEALDEKLGEPDCEDPAKAEWMENIEKRIAALEGAE